MRQTGRIGKPPDIWAACLCYFNQQLTGGYRNPIRSVLLERRSYCRATVELNVPFEPFPKNELLPFEITEYSTAVVLSMNELRVTWTGPAAKIPTLNPLIWQSSTNTDPPSEKTP